ncbi:MAG: SAM-dependent methyltransferase [Pseudomonadota bacterium]
MQQTTQPNPESQPDQPGYFEAMFKKSDDPWGFQTRWYEKRKRALTLACLPADRYAHGFEPGCANGELAARLATRCDKLLASDGIDKAVALSRARLKDHANVEVRKAWVPRDWPKDRFDLIVLSEFLFYLQPEVVEEIACKAQETLLPGGVILACHWRHPIEHCAITGDDAHDTLERHIALPNCCHLVEPDLRIDVWSAGPTVAEREGLS